MTLAKVPLQNLLVLLDCLILVRKVAERPTNARHELVDINFAIFSVCVSLFSIGMLVVAFFNPEFFVRDGGRPLLGQFFQILLFLFLELLFARFATLAFLVSGFNSGSAKTRYTKLFEEFAAAILSLLLGLILWRWLKSLVFVN